MSTYINCIKLHIDMKVCIYARLCMCVHKCQTNGHPIPRHVLLRLRTCLRQNQTFMAHTGDCMHACTLHVHFCALL